MWSKNTNLKGWVMHYTVCCVAQLVISFIYKLESWWIDSLNLTHIKVSLDKSLSRGINNVFFNLIWPLTETCYVAVKQAFLLEYNVLYFPPRNISIIVGVFLAHSFIWLFSYSVFIFQINNYKNAFCVL